MLRYWEARCRRAVKEVHDLLVDLDNVIETYKGDKGLDPETAEYLVSEQTEIVHAAVKNLIELGHIKGKYGIV